MLFKTFITALLFLTTSCGYHFGRGELIQRYSTVCVPYVEGDDEGVFTAELIHALNTQGCLSYRSCGADLALKVCLLAPIENNIGFIYAPKDETSVSNILTSNEARLMIVARLQLVDRRSGEAVFGPMEIESSIDYDFDPDLSHVASHDFSLGQLEMHNLAQDAAFPALYRLLAQKVVDYVNNSW